MELARLESAILAAIARELAGLAVHEVLHQLEVTPALGMRVSHDLRFEQPVEAEQSGVAAQPVAHEAIRSGRAFRIERVLEHGVEQIERRIALEVTGDQRQALFQPARVTVRFEQALRNEREVRRVLLLDALPMLDRTIGIS